MDLAPQNWFWVAKIDIRKKKNGSWKIPWNSSWQCFFSHPFCDWTLSFKDMSDSCQTWTHIIDMNGSWIESRSRLGSWKKATTTNKQHTTSNKQQQRQKPPESSIVLLVCLEKIMLDNFHLRSRWGHEIKSLFSVEKTMNMFVYVVLFHVVFFRICSKRQLQPDMQARPTKNKKQRWS